jgi:Fe2+ transport system protein FeoA
MNSDGEHWNYESVQILLSLAREGVPVSVISLKLKRPVTEVRAKLNDLGVTPAAEV